MASRPRRSAAQRATEAITDMADRDNALMSSSRSRRSAADSPSADSPHMHLTVKVPASKLRQATGRQAAASKRDQYGGRRSARATKKRYVESSEDEDEEDEEEEEEEEEEEQDEIRVGDDDGEEDEEDEEMDDAEGEEDADGEVDDMEVDAEGEDDDAAADADGDVDMDVTPAPAIKITKPSRSAASKSKDTPTKGTSRAAPRNIVVADDDDDDDELSELESDVEEEINDTVRVGGEEDAEGEEDEEEEEEEEEEVEEEDDDVDAEGEDVEVEEEDAEGEVEEIDSDDDGSRAETPDLAKMTKRQRARFEDEPQQYMKLSDEVQVKKVFTAEELSMRRAEMARRRRNLSEKRNEEVKTETINKLLKRQAPKTTKKGAGLAGNETPDVESTRPDPLFVRWISSKEGSRIAVPGEILEAPIGRVFVPGGSGPFGRKMVEEVS
ncbi:uncharacterized protein E0L32_010948 [Thyridium curvatum]|uniref:INO80 complex subunit B-like conserved region domain-containing protein n=1 Tax=Thyridium curvatum TaxID=1093900 RepID=A0A507AJT2_9PEZI|nr:uncharacterized protein E0L32_010948 [Thyridium curvatum]TPX07147.1 hypothetical protein E0L32_010948 [Thyridium curvatum]